MTERFRDVRQLLREATPRGPTGLVWDVVVIEGGWSKNGKYYSDDVLREAAPIFEGTPVHALEWRGHFDHLPDRVQDKGVRTSGLLQNRVGTLENVQFVEGSGVNRGRIVARLKFWKRAADLAESIRDEYLAGRPDVVGLSIDAGGVVEPAVAEGRRGYVVRRIGSVDSTDLVSYPAAGGRLARLVASRSLIAPEEEMDLNKILAALKRRKILESVDASWSREQQIAAIGKAVGDALDGSVVGLREALGEQRFAENVESLMRARELLAGGDVEGALAAIDSAIAEYQEMGEAGPAPADPPADPARMPESTPPAPAPAATPPATDPVREAREAAQAELAAARKAREDLEAMRAQAVADQQAARVARNKALVESRVGASGLPDISRDRVKASLLKLADAPDFAEQTIVEAIQDKREELAALSPGHEIRGLGATASAGVEGRDRLQAALDGLVMGHDVGTTWKRNTGNTRDVRIEEARKLNGSRYHDVERDFAVSWPVAGHEGEAVPRFRSLRQAIAAIRGGTTDEIVPEDVIQESRQFVRYYAPKRDEKIRESRGRLTESIQVSDWGQALGDSITRRMLRDYSLSSLNKWRFIVSTIHDAKDFRTQRRVRMGGYGTLATVSEVNTYPVTASGTPADEEATYAVAKRGEINDLSLEAIANDDIGAVQRIAKRFAYDANRTLHNFVFDFLLNNSAIYDAVALANAAHGSNISTTALSNAQMAVARRRMRNQTAFGDTAAVLGDENVPAWLLVPSSTEDVAFRLGTSEYFVEGEADANVGAGTREPNIHKGLKHLVVDYWDASDADNWWAVADPAKQETIEVGFYLGREDPEILVQDDPKVGSNFTADKISYKVRHIYGGAVMDFRPFFGGIV